MSCSRDSAGAGGERRLARLSWEIGGFPEELRIDLRIYEPCKAERQQVWPSVVLRGSNKVSCVVLSGAKICEMDREIAGPKEAEWWNPGSGPG
jgi:hypothetical protein